MAKRVHRERRDAHRMRRPATSVRTVAPGRGSESAPHAGRSVEDRLAQLLETPHFARIVPHLAPETLHQLIRYRGLDACGELVASATADQLTSLFDLDLWRNPQPGRDERFDAERFGEWIEIFVEAGASAAARLVAGMDANLAIAGLSRYVRVFDMVTLAAVVSSDYEPMDVHVAAPFGGLACEVGGYAVRARGDDAWDAIVTVLHALDAEHGDYFHAVMRGCRRLSNSNPEVDGLDDLLIEPEQLLHDIAVERERRQSQRGYSSAADARAFLEMARRPRHVQSGASDSFSPLAAAYFRVADDAAASADPSHGPQEPGLDRPTTADSPESIDAVVDLLAEAGLLMQGTRALLEGTAPRASHLTRMAPLMAHLRDTDDPALLMRARELAFLANTLKAGCSVQSRPFTVQEAHDAAVAVCNLGLEHWPACWPNAHVQGGEAPTTNSRATMPDAFLVEHDLVTAFEVGWAVLHEHVSLFVAEHLNRTLSELRCVDEETQLGLHTLQRELVKQRGAGTPWRARDALDVIAVLHLPAWASLLGLLGECPVLPDAMRAIVKRDAQTVSATAFEFISTVSHLREIRAFAERLGDLLRG